MTTWRSTGAAAVAALVLGLGGCANSDEGPASIDGRVDFVPADGTTAADQPAAAVAGTTGAGAKKADAARPDAATVAQSDLEVTAPDDVMPKGGDRKKCAAAVKASNTLLDKDVVALFRAKDLRQVEHLTPADTFNCSPKEGPDFGGVSALWQNITGAGAVKIFEAAGWTKQEPKTGPPAWETGNLPHGDGSLNYEPADQFVVTFHLTKNGREFWAELTQDGMRAGLDDAA